MTFNKRLIASSVKIAIIKINTRFFIFQMFSSISSSFLSRIIN